MKLLSVGETLLNAFSKNRLASDLVAFNYFATIKLSLPVSTRCGICENSLIISLLPGKFWCQHRGGGLPMILSLPYIVSQRLTVHLHARGTSLFVRCNCPKQNVFGIWPAAFARLMMAW
jgi:hypothetical protein